MKIGVVIARFQVPRLHKGHEALLNFTEANSDRVVVLLGISPNDTLTRENPLSFAQRKSVVQRSMPNAVILPLYDKMDHGQWTLQIDEILEQLFPFDKCTLFIGRESRVSNYYKGKCDIEILPEIVEVSGTDFRQRLVESTEEAFLRGQIFANCRRFPTSYQTVDIALIYRDELLYKLHGLTADKVLLIQRADTGQWCFPGGFVDSFDDSLEAAAKRELYEEVTIDLMSSDLVYVGSTRVDDWRYRWNVDRIMTAFYAKKLMHSGGDTFMPHHRVAPTEVRQAKLFPIFSTELETMISKCHVPLLSMLQQYVKGKIL